MSHFTVKRMPHSLCKQDGSWNVGSLKLRGFRFLQSKIQVRLTGLVYGILGL